MAAVMVRALRIAFILRSDKYLREAAAGGKAGKKAGRSE
jgi:hypothetical protein